MSKKNEKAALQHCRLQLTVIYEWCTSLRWLTVRPAKERLCYRMQQRNVVSSCVGPRSWSRLLERTTNLGRLPLTLTHTITLTHKHTTNQQKQDPRYENVITGVTELERSVTLQDVRDRVEQQYIAKFPRFSMSIAVRDDGTPFFQEMESVDLDRHVVEHKLASPSELNTYVADVMAEPMDLKFPMWHFHLVTYTSSEEATLLIRIHHMYADGVVLAQVFFQLMDLEVVTADAKPSSTRRQGPSALSQCLGYLNPLSLAHKVFVNIGGCMNALFLAALPADTTTQLKLPTVRGLSPRRSLACSRAVSLDLLKRIKARFGATVNDVLVSAIAGAVRRYLIAKQDAALHGCCGPKVRGMFPFNTHPHGADLLGADFKNDFCLLTMALPVACEGPKERMLEAKRLYPVGPNLTVTVTITPTLTLTPTPIGGETTL